MKDAVFSARFGERVEAEIACSVSGRILSRKSWYSRLSIKSHPLPASGRQLRCFAAGLLASRGGSVRAACNWYALGEWTGGNCQARFVEAVLQLAVQLKAVGINPECER